MRKLPKIAKPCGRERNRASWAAAYDKARAKKPRRTPAESKHTRLRRILAGEIPPTREDHLTLGQVSMLADKAGMSYGKYVVKYGL